MTTTTSHPTPDTRLIASSGAVEREPRSSGKGRVCSKSLPLLRGSGGFARPAGVLAHSPASDRAELRHRAIASREQRQLLTAACLLLWCVLGIRALPAEAGRPRTEALEDAR